MKCPRICQAKAIDDHTLVIEFTNHEVKKYDIVHLLDNPMFAPLSQPAFFKNFQVERGGLFENTQPVSSDFDPEGAKWEYLKGKYGSLA
ncbi:hypothetical protein PCC7424_4366 [Gloeothece citriformis PCC 7424]|uniref:DUF2442 domain-containing protein n=1 Tax=Gloeothece citriformis (strain PCC 7424) TaxID=65393 RepID=B7K8W3_GLOC7|nr:DUF2442 domain-containing protein [Gloeothece citriformis]ACK72732.1 hypothetical protein PCC7424_4366 [Gloeothece citriformis PCC 7424]